MKLLPASFNSRPMSRDKADTLLLIAACAVVLAPHAAHLPGWVSSICSLLICWRAWITLRGNRLPPRWMLLPIAMLCMGGVYWHFHTWFGRDAGVAMLVMLIVFKLLEMHARSDFWVAIFLAYFLALTQFFYSQAIPAAAATLLAVVLVLTAQLSFQYTGNSPPLARRLKLATLSCLIAMPIALALFLLFPRIQGPLWGMPGDARGSRTGLSETMSPGNISKLAESDDIAFRVKFAGEPPSKPALYWRGIVLGDFDGRTWVPLKLQRAAPEQISAQTGRESTRYQVTMEPSGRRWLFALELPISPPRIDGNPASFTPEIELRAERPINERIRYDAASSLIYRLQATETPPDLGNWLALPPGTNPLAQSFARQLHARHPDPVQAIQAVLEYFHREPFRYTLEPPLLGVQPVDDFLFGTRAGFCEHYSGAFVVLMRAMGIPARVVTGYQGGEINPIDGFMEVRQSDAHAWAEVWLTQRGWIRIDPTAAVAPERIEKNLSTAIPKTYFGGLVGNFGNGTTLSWIIKARAGWNALGNSWNQWVLNYSSDRQKSLVRSIGLDDSNWRDLILLLVGTLTLMTAAIAYWLTRSREKIDPIAAVYANLCREMEKRGLPRNRYEGPLSYRERLVSAAVLSDIQKTAASNFLDLYEAVQYGVPSLPRMEAATQLKKLLSQCR